VTTRAEPITLDDRYLRDKGLVYLSGVQALVRLPLDQNRRDRKAGLRIGTFVSGYLPWIRQDTRRTFTSPTRVTYHFHPPMLRALGMDRKLALGWWFTPALRLLRAGRRLRGTLLDPCGLARVRREERRLVPWYRDTLARALARLAPDTAGRVAEVAALPEDIRGYEDVKLRNVVAVKARAATLLAGLEGAPPASAP
jgi:indolepyruvate ferredoxin oxidoreductase